MLRAPHRVFQFVWICKWWLQAAPHNRHQKCGQATFVGNLPNKAASSLVVTRSPWLQSTLSLFRCFYPMHFSFCAYSLRQQSPPQLHIYNCKRLSAANTGILQNTKTTGYVPSIGCAQSFRSSALKGWEVPIMTTTGSKLVQFRVPLRCSGS